MSLINENHALIQAEGLQKIYTRGNEKVVALHGVDLTVPAEETVNGIQSNHFTFKVSGLGAKSGAEVTANQGEYWLAVDGRYIFKYTLVLESRTVPLSEILHEEISIDLTDINNPIDISFPQSCINAKNAKPTPPE